MIPASVNMMIAGSSLHPFTQDWINAFTNPATSGLALSCDKFVKSLVGAGVWGKLDIMAGMPMLNSQQSLINCITPNTDDFTAVGSPVFTPKQGWKWVTSGSRYLIASTNMDALTKYQQNNASFGCYTFSNVGASGQVDVGTPSSNNMVINPRNASNVWQGRINSSGLYTGAGTFASSVGHHAMRRTSSTINTGFKDGVSLGDSSIASSAVPATPFGILTAPSAQSSRECGIGYCGAALSDSEFAALDAAINTLISDVALL